MGVKIGSTAGYMYMDMWVLASRDRGSPSAIRVLSQQAIDLRSGVTEMPFEKK